MDYGIAHSRQIEVLRIMNIMTEINISKDSLREAWYELCQELYIGAMRQDDEMVTEVITRMYMYWRKQLKRSRYALNVVKRLYPLTPN